MYVAASLRPVGSVMVRRIRDPSRVRAFVYAVIRCYKLTAGLVRLRQWELGR